MGWITHILSFLVVLIGIGMTIFTNYPAPPFSPILFQWKDKGNFFKYKEYNVFYKDEIMDENSTKPAILCLHGFPTSSFDYYQMFPHLRRSFDRVILIDYLGLGFSDKPRFHIYTLMEQTLIVEKILQHLKLKDIHILSHDIGDSIAQELIARQNEGKSVVNIKSVNMLNGGIFPSVYRPIFIQKLLTYPIIGTILSRFHTYYTYRYILDYIFGEKKLTIAEMHDFWHIAMYNDGFRVFGHLLNYMSERTTYENRWVNALKITNIPLQFIYGPADPINVKSDFINYYKNNIPNPNLRVLNDKIGHYPNLESPKEVMDLVIKFLNEKKFNDDINYT